MAEISVIGAGFVGLSFALAAKQRGFDVDVFDLKSRPKVADQLSCNVIATNLSSSAFLDELGVWRGIDDRFKTGYSSMSVFDGAGTGAVTFNAEEAGRDLLGHIVDQAALLAALANVAEAQSLRVHWQTPADINSMSTQLLVAADGVHSRTREALGLKKIGYSYHQTATVCIAETSDRHQNRAHQWFLESGPLAMLPLSESNKVAVVWSSFDDVSELSEGDFIEQLNFASEDALGAIVSVSERFGFSLMQQAVWQYVDEGVALLGDAAHAIHPLAGQGANLGFADARCLVTELASARLEGRQPGDLNVLRRYQRARKKENYLAAIAMEGFHRLFTSSFPIIGLLRSHGLKVVNENKTLKRLAIDVASGRL